jgi:hypothetical protein
LNAASSEGIPFACMTEAAISADVSGPDAVRKASCVSRESEIPCPAIGPFGRDGIGICARRKQLDRGVQICEIRPLARDPFFEVVNVAADFSALPAKG